MKGRNIKVGSVLQNQSRHIFLSLPFTQCVAQGVPTLFVAAWGKICLCYHKAQNLQTCFTKGGPLCCFFPHQPIVLVPGKNYQLNAVLPKYHARCLAMHLKFLTPPGLKIHRPDRKVTRPLSSGRHKSPAFCFI